MTPVHAKTRPEKPSWSDATVALPDSVVGKDTPVASSSTLEPQRNGRRKRMVLLGLGAAILLGVAGGFALNRMHGRDRALVAESATSNAIPPPATDPLPAATASVTAAPAVSVVAAASAQAPSSAPVAGETDDRPTPSSPSSSGSHGPASARNAHAPRAARDAGTTQAASSEAAKPSPTPATPNAPTKPADTVEGREIRTNL